MINPIILSLGFLVWIVSASACLATDEVTAPFMSEALEPMPDGFRLFLLHDYGGISDDTLDRGSALPFKVVQTAMILLANETNGSSVALEEWPNILQKFGIQSPKFIHYGSNQSIPWDGSPVGIVRRKTTRGLGLFTIEGVNIGCASCHSGIFYNKMGQPQPERLHLGSPSTSFNPEEYSVAVYQALKFALSNSNRFYEALNFLYPDLSWRESLAIKWFIMPNARKHLNRLIGQLDRPFPFISGGPGLTNGVAALKLQMKMLSEEKMAKEAGYTSIPELADRSLRKAFLYDQLYSPKTVNDPAKQQLQSFADIIALFTVPAFGVDPGDISKHLASIKTTLRDVLPKHRPQRFPGTIDKARAKRGQKIYVAQCQKCHGQYSGPLIPGSLRLVSYPEKASTIRSIRTDSERANVTDDALKGVLERASFDEYATINIEKKYVATILTGIWNSAPYLHNGSVPTLWHLLNPDKRPSKFQVGGHALDFKKVGIAGRRDSHGVYVYDDQYHPWSKSSIYDTSQIGCSNKGHEAEFIELSNMDKLDLIEFMKCL